MSVAAGQALEVFLTHILPPISGIEGDPVSLASALELSASPSCEAVTGHFGIVATHQMKVSNERKSRRPRRIPRRPGAYPADLIESEDDGSNKERCHRGRHLVNQSAAQSGADSEIKTQVLYRDCRKRAALIPGRSPAEQIGI